MLTPNPNNPTILNNVNAKANPLKIFIGYNPHEDLAYELESTEFSFSRFRTPYLANYQGWAMFYPIMCVQHDYAPKETTKMDGAMQTVYPRKNWFSMVLYNCGHPKNWVLTPEVVNSDEIESVPFVWNFLVGHNRVVEGHPSMVSKVIQYTLRAP
ncbi:hypothetical protein CsSME_00052356 [Camellia sinensis var. sinensis]